MANTSKCSVMYMDVCCMMVNQHTCYIYCSPGEPTHNQTLGVNWRRSTDPTDLRNQAFLLWRRSANLSDMMNMPKYSSIENAHIDSASPRKQYIKRRSKTHLKPKGKPQSSRPRLQPALQTNDMNLNTANLAYLLHLAAYCIDSVRGPTASHLKLSIGSACTTVPGAWDVSIGTDVTGLKSTINLMQSYEIIRNITKHNTVALDLLQHSEFSLNTHSFWTHNWYNVLHFSPMWKTAMILHWNGVGLASAFSS